MKWNRDAGAWLRQAVRELDLPLTELADALELNVSTLHRWFSGTTDPLSPHSANREAFERLARKLRFRTARELLQAATATGTGASQRPAIRMSHAANTLLSAVRVRGAETFEKLSQRVPSATAALEEALSRGVVVERNPIGSGRIVYDASLGIAGELAARRDQRATMVSLASSLRTGAATIAQVAASDATRFDVSDATVTLRKRDYELIIFDWSNTLADEVQLDEAICEDFAERVGVKPFRTLLDTLEEQADHRWFDYFYLAERCGLRREDVEAFHLRHRGLIRWVPGADRLLRQLRRRKLALATNCARDVLAIRLELLQLSSKAFDVTITSTDTRETLSKEAAYREISDRTGIAPESTVVVSDDFDRDILPALTLGSDAIWFFRDSRRQFYGSPSPPVPAHEVVRRRSLANAALPTAIAVSHDETAGFLI